MDDYNVPKEVEKQVIKYCYEQFGRLKKPFIVSQGIKLNVFLEIMYDVSMNNYIQYKTYLLTEMDFKKIYSYAQNFERTMQEFVNREIELMAVNSEGILVFKRKKLLIE